MQACLTSCPFFQSGRTQFATFYVCILQFLRDLAFNFIYWLFNFLKFARFLYNRSKIQPVVNQNKAASVKNAKGSRVIGLASWVVKNSMFISSPLPNPPVSSRNAFDLLSKPILRALQKTKGERVLRLDLCVWIMWVSFFFTIISEGRTSR